MHSDGSGRPHSPPPVKGRWRRGKPVPIWQTAVAFLIGIVCCVAGAMNIVADRDIEASAVRTTATVTDFQRFRRGPDSATVEYRVGEVIVSSTFGVERRLRVGESVEIEYERAYPENARVAGDRADRNEGVIMALAGVTFVGASIWSWLRRPTPRRFRVLKPSVRKRDVPG